MGGVGADVVASAAKRRACVMATTLVDSEGVEDGAAMHCVKTDVSRVDESRSLPRDLDRSAVDISMNNAAHWNRRD